MKRGDHPVNLQSAFSPGAITATGERIFVPFRKRIKQEEEIDSNLKSNGIKSYGVVHHSSVLSDDEVKLIRLQNQISLEGSDIVCNPILKFSNAGLHPIFIQRLQEKGITVIFE